MPKAIGSILWDVGFPCVTSSLCLIQLALLQLTQVRRTLLRRVHANRDWLQLKFGSEILRSKSCLSCVVTSHFGVVIGADVAVAFSDSFLVSTFQSLSLTRDWVSGQKIKILIKGMQIFESQLPAVESDTVPASTRVETVAYLPHFIACYFLVLYFLMITFIVFRPQNTLCRCFTSCGRHFYASLWYASATKWKNLSAQSPAAFWHVDPWMPTTKVN